MFFQLATAPDRNNGGYFAAGRRWRQVLIVIGFRPISTIGTVHFARCPAVTQNVATCDIQAGIEPHRIFRTLTVT
jgi:hypothetical protein